MRSKVHKTWMVGKISTVRTHYRVLFDFSLWMASRRWSLILLMMRGNYSKMREMLG